MILRKDETLLRMGEVGMTMKLGQRYRCLNPDCRCETEVTRASTEANTNPRCCCGAEMKKPYARPVLRELTTKPAISFGTPKN